MAALGLVPPAVLEEIHRRQNTCKTEYGNWWDRLHSTVSSVMVWRWEQLTHSHLHIYTHTRTHIHTHSSHAHTVTKPTHTHHTLTTQQDFCLVPKSDSSLHSLHNLNCKFNFLSHDNHVTLHPYRRRKRRRNG